MNATVVVVLSASIVDTSFVRVVRSEPLVQGNCGVHLGSVPFTHYEQSTTNYAWHDSSTGKHVLLVARLPGSQEESCRISHPCRFSCLFLLSAQEL